MTLVSGERLSKIREIKEGISRFERGYGGWRLRRELPVSDPGRDTKLPLKQRVLLVIYCDYRAMLEVYQEEMKSNIFFGIDKENMVEVKEKMEKRLEDGKMVPGTRISHHFIPQSASQIGYKLCSEYDSFVDIHDFKIPIRVEIDDIATSSYISCVYNSLWWVGLVNKADEKQGDVDV